MAQRQYCTPHTVAAGRALALPRVSLDDRTLPESWYQQLLFEHPSLIPVDEIEPAFGPLIPLARELQVGGGRVDVVYINAQGYLTLVETKLWRNPDARRSVVSQIIEYATAMAKWTYADLRERMSRPQAGEAQASPASNPNDIEADPILRLVRGEPGFDQVRFVDTVTRNLRLGRFLLIIAGDGIKDGVEELAETMQASPHLGYTLALLETAVYRLGNNAEDLLVQPRVLARTREIVRHVIEIRNTHPAATVNVIPPPPTPDTAVRSITEAAFIERLTQNTDAATASFASRFVQEVARTPGLRLTWSKEGPALWWDDDADDRQAALLRLRASGELSATNGLASFCARYALPMSIADHYQDQLVRLLPGSKRVERGAEGYTHVMASNGGYPSFTPLASRSDEFWKLITDTTASLAKAAEERRNQPAN